MNLSTAASQLNRVGSVLKRSLGRLGIETVKDLLYYFPFRYEDYSQVVRIKDLQDGQEVTVRGKIELIGNKRSPRKQTMITEALVADETGQLRIIWFGQPFIVKILKAGDEVFLSGKVKSDMFGVQITGPSYEKVRSSGVSLNTPLPPVRLVPLSHHEVSSRLEASRGEDDGVISTTHTARIVPIYSLTAGVTEKQLRFLVSQAIGVRSQVPEWVPEEIRDTADLMPIDEALRAIHFPESQDELDHAMKRLKFDEVFLLQLRAEMTRQSIKRSQAPKFEFKEKETKEFVSSLPFELTKDQKVSAWEILKDIQKSEPMNRLLEGDVGSGKTVVASMALYNTVLNGYQGVMMAPTEILAKQHFESLINLFKNLNVRVGLLSRSQVLIYGDTIEIHGDSKKIFQPISTYRNVSKQDFLKEMQEGNLQIIVGTHALLTESVQFKNLGLVIVDEQHRFGVNQRAALIRGQTRTVADERGPLTDADLRGLSDADLRGLDADLLDDEKVAEGKKLLYEDLTYKIRKCLFAVRKNIGLGHKENIYGNALEIEFKKEGLNFEKEKIIDVKYDNKKIGVYRSDFVIENKVIIELKALPFMGQKEKRQVWTYLKGSSYTLALLVNYSHKDVEIERVVYDIARQQTHEEVEKSASSPRQSALSISPHFLSMTATPIPRSFALTLYGDLDLSIIKQMPVGRKVIKTRLVDPHNREKAYQFIRDQVKQGRQVFVICPLIEEKIGDEVVTGRDLSLRARENLPNTGSEKKSVMQEYEKLSTRIFPDLKVGFLHGKLKSGEKDDTMKQFTEGKIDILVSTSVVEVGVNIPNASVMMIEGAERFGLAQLHQFRGRVGRSEYQSYCFLFMDSDSFKAKERLTFFEKTNDGFELAEYDLKVRGPGEVYGVSQSGMMNFKLATLQDHDIIKLARDVARGVDFSRFDSLRKKVEEWEEGVHLE